MTEVISIDFSRLNEATNDVFYPLYWCKERWLVLMGGSGSGKSVFSAQKALYRVVSGRRHIYLVLRKVAATIRNSTWRLFLSIIDAWGWRGLIVGNPTMKTQDLRLVFRNGSEIVFAGLDDAEKIKSITGVTSIWCEEATEFSQDDIEQLNIRLRGIRHTYMQITLTFNPISLMHWLKKMFWDKPRNRAKVLVTTYRDNRWVTPDDVTTYEEMKRTNPAMYQVYGLGQWGLLKGLIYTPPVVLQAKDWPADDWFDEIIYCGDFGFNHPMAFNKIGLKDGKRAYIKQLIHRSGMTTADLTEELKGMKLDAFAPMYCDAAEPDRIEELCRAGFNAHPANKSVAAGINTVKSFDLYLHEDGQETLKEFYSYSWAVDKNGNPLDKPVKFNDDGVDAIRYGLHTHLTAPDAGLFTLDHDVTPGYAA